MTKRRSSKRGERWAKSFARRRPTREPRARVLIVCEGKRTEPTYFIALCRDKRLTAAEVEVVQSELGTNPRNVVDYAVDRKNEASDDEEPYDEVWCVFDRDEHDGIPEALNRARDCRIEVAFSNPSFELWFLQHFRYSSGYIERDAAESKLKQDIPDYHKSMDVYERILSQQEDAVVNARRLVKHHTDLGDAPTNNPSTTVYKLVTALNELAES